MQLPGSSVRTKLALATTFLVGAISIFIYLYFPARLQEQAEKALIDEAYSVTQMVAFTVGNPLSQRASAVPELYQALSALRENNDVAYAIVFDKQNKLVGAFGVQLAEQYKYSTLAMEKHEAGKSPSNSAIEINNRATGAEGGFTTDRRIYQTHGPVGFRGRHVGDIYVGLSTDRLNEDVKASERAVSFVSLVIFFGGVLAAFVISGTLAAPLRAMVGTTKKIAAGNLAERARVEGDDEVAQLARSFNVMVERLSEAQGELSVVNRNLEQRVEDRTRELREEMTERRRAERRYRLLFERNLAGVYIATVDGRIVECNDASARMLGYDSAESLMNRKGTIQYFDPAEHQEMMDKLLVKGSVVNHEARLLRRDGDVVWVLETLGASSVEHEETPVVEGIILDITDRKRSEQEVEFQAYHDPLTGLPNRMLFIDRLTVAVALSRRHEQPLAVMFLDLDDLKIVNDTLGHAAGDQLLQMVGERLIGCLRQEDTVARIGGDEFTLLLPALNTPADAAAVAAKVIETVAQPFVIGEDEVRVTTSIGIAMYPADGEDPETLLANADGTMYRVKESGGSAYRFCSQGLDRRTLGRMTMEESLKQALERNEFVVYYQPQVDSRTRDVVAMEALVRWQHPEIGLIEPAGFISLAEYTGLIIPIGEWVLREACRQAREWNESGPGQLRVGVNVSARQFYQRDFLGMVDRALQDTRLPPELLELEITETMAMQKSDRTLQILNKVRDRGVSIALDDFGTGQSSLTYLKRFPIRTVKIDRSFVSGVGHAVIDAPIVEAVLHLASSLGLRTVAEGVETSEQYEFLAQRNCSEMQGYYISRPLAAEAFARFLSPSEKPAV